MPGASRCRPRRSTRRRSSAAGDELVETLRSLIRIPSVNPPYPPTHPTARRGRPTGSPPRSADAGVEPEILELVPGPRLGRRPAARRRHRAASRSCSSATSTSCPRPPSCWTHDPFAGDLADGYVWGRGAVDMKNLLAMELTVVRMLAAEARAAGRDPASDPIPGLTRDVLFASTADEEAGGLNGIGWIVAERPELLRGRGRDQRIRRGRDDVRRPPLLPDRRRREGLRGRTA